MAILTGFVSSPLPHSFEQETLLSWLADAHADAAALPADDRARLHRLMARVACPPAVISRRALAVDYRGRWADHELHGRGTGARTARFAGIVDRYFEVAYGADMPPPDDLVHVTCTGYTSPSGAQKLVARRRWPTRVTHAYQMGCYAAIPALRIALGALATGSARVDIAHTELCSLHFDPGDASAEQLVVHSLFADGLIRYRCEADAPPRSQGALRVVAVHELVVPGSEDAMSWVVGDAGHRMTLARDVPERIAGALRSFVIELLARAGRNVSDLARARLALHPGGPKIVDRVRDVLELTESQLAVTRGVLRDHGNMSSATVPHVWMRLANDPSVEPGTLIPTLAFGPGLTMCGAVLEKL